MINVDTVAKRLRRHQPDTQPPEPEPARCAAVAIVIAGQKDACSICFIKRAARTQDPWSGQMALPGGRASPEDPDLRSVAIRETFEEVGLDLTVAEELGVLSQMPIGWQPERDLGILSPFVFYLHGALPGFLPQTSEVAAAYWIPAQHLWDPHNRHSFELEGNTRSGIEYRGEIIWGLTLRVIRTFSEVIQQPLPD